MYIKLSSSSKVLTQLVRFNASSLLSNVDKYSLCIILVYSLIIIFPILTAELVWCIKSSLLSRILDINLK